MLDYHLSKKFKLGYGEFNYLVNILILSFTCETKQLVKYFNRKQRVNCKAKVQLQTGPILGRSMSRSHILISGL
jgi:hypothetical protein